MTRAGEALQHAGQDREELPEGLTFPQVEGAAEARSQAAPYLELAQRARHREVAAAPAAGRYLREDLLSLDRLGEAIASSRGHDPSGAYEVAEGGLEGADGDPGPSVRDHGGLEAAADDRQAFEPDPGAAFEGREPLIHRLKDPLGSREVVGRDQEFEPSILASDGAGPAPLFHQAQDLLDAPWDSAGPFMKGAREPKPGDRVVEGVLDDPEDRFLADRLQRDRDRERLHAPPQFGEPCRPPESGPLPLAKDQQQARLLQAPGHSHERVEGRGAGEVDVVQEEDGRAGLPQRQHPLAEGCRLGHLLILRRARARVEGVDEGAGDGGRHRGLQQGPGSRSGGDVLGEMKPAPNQGQERGAGALLGHPLAAPIDVDRRGLGASPDEVHELRHQPGLAHAALPAQERHGATIAGLTPRSREQVELHPAACEWEVVTASPGGPLRPVAGPLREAGPPPGRGLAVLEHAGDGRAGRAVRGSRRKGREHDRVEQRGQPRDHVRGRRDPARSKALEVGRDTTGRGAHGDLEEERAEGEGVRCRGCSGAACALRRDKAGRAEGRLRRALALGVTEVHEAGAARSVQPDVVWLDVAVDPACLVKRGKGRGQPGADRPHRGFREGTGDLELFGQ